MESLLNGLLPLAGVVLGSWLGYRLSRKQSRSERLDALFDEAESSVYELQAARYFATGIPEGLLGNADTEGAMTSQTRMDGVQAFIESAAECRRALARLQPFCSELRSYWDKLEVSEAEADLVIDLLRKCRQSL